MINTLLQLQNYMGKRKLLLPAALLLSSLSTLSGLMPFIFIWLIISDVVTVNAIDNYSTLINYGWWAMGTAVTGIVLYFMALSLSHLAAFRVETSMRQSAMERLLKMPLGFFDNNTTGKIRKIIDDNISITHSFLAHQMPDLAGSVLTPLTALALIFIIDWRMGIATLFPIIGSLLIMSFMMGKKGRFFMEQYMTSLEEMNTEAIEYVRGIPVVKVFQQTVFSFKSFHKSIIRYRDMVTAYTNNWKNPMSIYTIVIHSFVYVLVPVAVIVISYKGEVITTLVNLLFYVLITPMFANSIMKSMYLSQSFGQAEEALRRVNDLCSAEPLAQSNSPKVLKAEKVSFNNVSFTYPGCTRKAVDNVGFCIPQGHTFALVGPSGGGKTTIAKLLPRFWDVEAGSVTIGKTNIKEFRHEDLMNHVAFVFQNTHLFKTTLRENICYGRPMATDEEITKAIELAQCTEIIERLPQGIETRIGAEGTYLSGGEQQRIALARAILKDAPIVVLDEATAFADPENEHLLQKALRQLTRGKTVLMIAHRLTSVVAADKILVIENGSIEEQGKHHELLEQKGQYAMLWKEYQKAVNWTIKHEEVVNIEEDAQEFISLFTSNN